MAEKEEYISRRYRPLGGEEARSINDLFRQRKERIKKEDEANMADINGNKDNAGGYIRNNGALYEVLPDKNPEVGDYVHITLFDGEDVNVFAKVTELDEDINGDFTIAHDINGENFFDADFDECTVVVPVEDLEEEAEEGAPDVPDMLANLSVEVTSLKRKVDEQEALIDANRTDLRTLAEEQAEKSAQAGYTFNGKPLDELEIYVENSEGEADYIGSVADFAEDSPDELSDAVQSPSHYTQARFETIEMIEEITQGYEDGFVAHCVGTSTKYNSRAPFKRNMLEDLKKSRQYLTFAIDYLERKEDE